MTKIITYVKAHKLCTTIIIALIGFIAYQNQEALGFKDDATVAAAPQVVATPEPVPVVVNPEPPSVDPSVMGAHGSGYQPGAYQGGLGVVHVYSFSQEKTDDRLGVIILPNYYQGRAIAVGKNAMMPDFVYHVQKPEGFSPIVHPKMKDASGRHIVVFQKVGQGI